LTRYYSRTSPGVRENAGAGAVAFGLAAGVAAVTFYLVRLMLARVPLEDPDTEGPEKESGPGWRQDSRD
jgi:hypothetical protein